MKYCSPGTSVAGNTLAEVFFFLWGFLGFGLAVWFGSAIKPNTVTVGIGYEINCILLFHLCEILERISVAHTCVQQS